MANPFRARGESEDMASYLKAKQDYEIKNTGSSGVNLGPSGNAITNNLATDVIDRPIKEAESYSSIYDTTREKELANRESELQTINQIYQQQLDNEKRSIMAAGEKDLARSNTISAITGMMGAPEATTRAGQSESRTKTQLTKAEDYYTAQKAAAVQAFYDKVDTLTADKAKIEYAASREEAEKAQAEQATGALNALNSMATTGMSWDALMTADPETVNKLVSASGKTGFEVQALYEASMPKEAQTEVIDEREIKLPNGNLGIRRITSDGQKRDFDLGTPYVEGTETRDVNTQVIGNEVYLFPKEMTNEELNQPLSYWKVGNNTDYQFVPGTENQPGGVFDKTTGTFTPYTDKTASGVVTDASGSSYNIASYATDPNHETAVQSILNRIGQMTSYQQMDNYIQQVAPGSKVTGEMIGNASQKYGVSWETMMAIMQQDSNFGTAGAGARSFNPGNVGNTETATSTGQLVNFGNWQSGVDAVAKNLAWRKVSDQPTVDAEVEANVSLVNQGRLTTKEALDKLPEEKRGAFVYQLAQTTSDETKQKQEATQADAQQKIALIDETLSSSALNDAVGPNWFARDWGSLDLSKFTGQYQNFIGNVQQLASQEFISNLIESKQAGATYGSLTEREGQALREAATKINNWAEKDESGNVIGYNISESAFKRELNRIKDAATKVNSGVQVMPDGTQWKMNDDGSLTQIQ